MGKAFTLRWAAYTRNQEAVAEAIARKEYVDLTPTGVGVVDELFALMDQIGTLKRLEVEGNYQRRMVPMVLLVTTYCAKVIMGLRSQNQIPTHLFRDAGLLRRIGYTAKQVEEGTCGRGKGLARPIHKNTVADGLERLTEAESAGIFRGSVIDLVKAKLVHDTVFSMDGMEMHATEHCPEAGQVTSTRDIEDKWGRVKTVTSTRYGDLLLSLRGVESNTVVAATVKKIGTSEHVDVMTLVREGKAAGVRIRILLIDGAYCVGEVLWQLKHEEKVDFIVPADSSMCITEDARGLATLKEGLVVEENREIRAVGVTGLTTYGAYRPPQPQGRRGPKPTLNAVVVTRWKGKEVPREDQKVLITSLSVEHPLEIVALYRKRAEMENKLHRELKQGWYILGFPSKKYLARLAHIFLTLTLYNIACAYKTERGRELGNRGIRRLRAQHLGGAAWVLIVYTATEYGIFDVEEFAYLSGNPPRRFHRYKPPKETLA
ncbi:MAG: transposase [Deltaproteobacteria bacterium]|nr:transposase [Deltaproteobacteria bacterium]